MTSSDKVSVPEISIVIPVFNESTGVDILWAELRPVMDGLEKDGHATEVLFVDDGSTDDSLECLIGISAVDTRVRVVELLCNSGQHAALAAGFSEARGKAVVTLDADLQNPPGEIPKIVEKVLEGYDLVSGIRVGRKDSPFRTMAGAMSSRISSFTTGIRLTDYGSMLRGYSLKVAQAVAAAYQPGAYIPAVAYVYAKRRIEIETGHSPRTYGESKYGIRALLRLHADILTGFSVMPLRLAALAGVVVAVFGMALGAYIIIQYFIQGEVWAQYGVFTLFAVAFFFMGVQLVAIALMGEYIGRMYTGARRRPQYIIRTIHQSGGEERL